METVIAGLLDHFDCGAPARRQRMAADTAESPIAWPIARSDYKTRIELYSSLKSWPITASGDTEHGRGIDEVCAGHALCGGRTAAFHNTLEGLRVTDPDGWDLQTSSRTKDKHD